jgi:hypothetical protein
MSDNVVEKLVPPPVLDLSNHYIEVIPTPVPDLSSDSIEMIPTPVPDPLSDSIELSPPPVCDLSNDSIIQLIPSPKPIVQITQVRPFPKAIQSAKVRVTKSRVGKCRVFTETPEKDQIEQGYVRQQEKLMKSSKAKRALLQQHKEKCVTVKSQKKQVQSENVTEKNETPIVCIDKKRAESQK